MIINDLDDYYIVFDTKNRNIELDTLINNSDKSIIISCETFKKGKVTFILVDSSNYSILSTRTIFVKW